MLKTPAQIIKEWEAKFTPAMDKACLVVERAAKQKAPVESGNLRNSITHEVVSGKEGLIGTNVPYAPYVEIGTGMYSSEGNGRQGGWCYCDAEGKFHFTYGSQPKPFLKPALDESHDAILKCFEGIL